MFAAKKGTVSKLLHMQQKSSGKFRLEAYHVHDKWTMYKRSVNGFWQLVWNEGF